MKQLEDTLLPGEADIGSYIGRFFGEVCTLSDVENIWMSNEEK